MNNPTTRQAPATATRHVEPCGSGDVQWIDLTLSPQTVEQLIRALVETLRGAPRLQSLIAAQIYGTRTLDDPKAVEIRQDLAASMDWRGHTAIHLTAQDATDLADDLTLAAESTDNPDPCTNPRCSHLAVPGSEYCEQCEDVMSA